MRGSHKIQFGYHEKSQFSSWQCHVKYRFHWKWTGRSKRVLSFWHFVSCKNYQLAPSPMINSGSLAAVIINTIQQPVKFCLFFQSLILGPVHNLLFGATDVAILDFGHLDCQQSNSQPFDQKSDALLIELSRAAYCVCSLCSWFKLKIHLEDLPDDVGVVVLSSCSSVPDAVDFVSLVSLSAGSVFLV